MWGFNIPRKGSRRMKIGSFLNCKQQPPRRHHATLHLRERRHGRFRRRVRHMACALARFAHSRTRAFCMQDLHLRTCTCASASASPPRPPPPGVHHCVACVGHASLRALPSMLLRRAHSSRSHVVRPAVGRPEVDYRMRRLSRPRFKNLAS